MIDDLDDRFAKSRQMRSPFERHWVLQLAYYCGNQWMAIDRTGRLYEPEIDPYALKLVDNRIMPAVLAQTAKMTKQRPIMTVVPRTADDSDVYGALMGERVMDWQWEYLDLGRKLRGALLWSRVCAAGFWKTCWDPQKGDSFDVLTVVEDPDQPPKVLLDEYGRPMRADNQQAGGLLEQLPSPVRETVGKKTVPTGDVAVHVRSPFEIFPDELAPETGLEDAEWIGEEVVQSVEYLRARYDVDLPADSSAQAGISESRIPGFYGSEQPQKVGVVTREFWAKPNTEFPDGKHVVYAGGEILHEGDNDYGWLPYVMFRGTPVPGRFWPTCFTEQAISPQTELNKTLSQIAENGQRVGNPPLAESRQANVKWNGLPGERVLFDDTMANSLPQFLQVPEMPGYIQNRIPQLIEAIQEQAGQHEVSHGNVPTGVTAAAAINLLQEADDTRLGPDILDMEKSLGDAGKRILQLVGKHYTDSRVIKIAGEDGAWDIFDFKGAALKGNTDVQVQAGSGMPRSKAAKQAAMQEVLNLALQYGVELDQRSLRKFFVDYEAGGLERLFGDIDADERQVQREHRRLALGQAFAPNEFDNDAFHVDAHNEFRKGSRYEQLPSPAKDVFDEHVRLHEQAMQPEVLDPAAVVPPTAQNGAAPAPSEMIPQ